MFTFWIEMKDGTRLSWYGISQFYAKALNAATTKSCDDKIIRFGWSEV